MVTKEKVLKQLKKVMDPEVDVSIVDLGLIYGVEIKEAQNLKVSKGEPKVSPLRQGFVGQAKVSKGENGGKRLLRSARNDSYDVNITMTLTSPGCPLADVFQYEVTDAVKKIKGVRNVTVELVWEPMWTPDRMSEEAKEKAGIL